MLVKPYETYQTFDSEGNPIDAEKKSIIQDLTDLGYQFDGLKTGYPGGEPDWLYCKDLNELTEKTLLNSFSKKGKALVKKADKMCIRDRDNGVAGHEAIELAQSMGVDAVSYTHLYY